MKNIILELKDVNLSQFFIELDKNKITIEVLNMTNGDEVCTIMIENIMTLKYENNIDEDEILPAYLGELKISQNIETNNFHIEMQGWVDSFIDAKSCFINYA
ncbi:hypothetical protein RHO13_04810 [Orbus wheelerorum]|uniref:hypothetical protein n=1 Tax=Orbus wheelerorum TaxID=3074111 RepID=UPI00370D6A6D